MEIGERPPWWRHVPDLGGRPDDDYLDDTPGPNGDEPPRPSRRALAADVVVAIVLTVIAVTVSGHHGPSADRPAVIEYLRLPPASPHTP
ncbi:hypothetical protein IMZ11_11395, partial [Microtetraspora sp. AC03309]|uniref:hypothetical protein n=1 Tax=Microtetraspora sp. AC03309 TaxID=2779376 RepID=UPI001E515EA3